MDNSRPFISIANHYHVQELLSALKRLDKPTILLWIIKSVFQNGYATDSWIVVSMKCADICPIATLKLMLCLFSLYVCTVLVLINLFGVVESML